MNNATAGEVDHGPRFRPEATFVPAGEREPAMFVPDLGGWNGFSKGVIWYCFDVVIISLRSSNLGSVPTNCPIPNATQLDR
jgi:hypothetical protein